MEATAHGDSALKVAAPGGHVAATMWPHEEEESEAAAAAEHEQRNPDPGFLSSDGDDALPPRP